MLVDDDDDGARSVRGASVRGEVEQRSVHWKDTEKATAERGVDRHR